MNTAEHLLVLVSIVIGLALTDLLTRVQRLVHARERVRIHWLPLAWMGFVFLALIQFWWSFFTVVQAEVWRHFFAFLSLLLAHQAEPALLLLQVWRHFFAFLSLLLIPVTTYLLAASTLPDVGVEGTVNLRQHYFEHRGWFFLLAALTLLLVVTSELLRGRAFLHPVRVFHGAFLLLFLSLAWTRSERFHVAVIVLVFALFVIFVALYTPRIA